MNPVLNIIAFHTIWVACAAGAGYGYSWAGPALLAFWLPVHFRLSPHRRADLILVVASAVFGTLVDTGYMLAGWIKFNGVTAFAGLAPLWITALWVNFALTLNHSLAFLKGRPLWSALLGAGGVPFAYYGGATLGAATLSDPAWLALAGIAAAWLFACPALSGAAQRLQPVPRS